MGTLDRGPLRAYDVMRRGEDHTDQEGDAHAITTSNRAMACAATGLRRLHAGVQVVRFYDPDGIPLEYYYMDAAYADVYGVDIEPI